MSLHSRSSSPRFEPNTWLHACSPTSHAATDSMLALPITRTVAGTRCCSRASTSCSSTTRTRFHVPKKSPWHAPPVRPRCAPTSPALPALPFLKPQLPTAAFTKSTIVPKVTRRETVDVEPTPFFVSILRPYWTVLFCSESGYLLQGSHWSRSSCGRPSVGRSSERRFSGTYTRW